MPLPDNRKSKAEIDAELKKLEELEEDSEELEEDEDTTEDQDDSAEDESDNDESEEDDDEGDRRSRESDQQQQLQADKQRLDDSVRGAELEHQKNRKYQDALKEASKINDVPEEDVIAYTTAQGLDWEDMTATERILAKNNLIQQKRFDIINNTVKDETESDERREVVDEWIDSDESIKQFPKLEGKEADFKKFAMKPSRRNMDMEDIAILFLANNPEPTKKKGSLFLQGGGGEKVKKTQMTAEDVSRLRQKDPRKWQRLVREGKIDPTKDL